MGKPMLNPALVKLSTGFQAGLLTAYTVALKIYVEVNQGW